MWQDDQNQYPNSYTGFWGEQKGDVTVKGLLNSVKGVDVKFKYADPGFVKQEDLPVTDRSGNTVYLRKVYKDYKLNFDRTGDTYKLSTVYDENGKWAANAGANFFPLDSVGYQVMVVIKIITISLDCVMILRLRLEIILEILSINLPVMTTYGLFWTEIK